MATIDYGKALLQKILKPCVSLLAQWGVRPNQISLATVIIAIIMGLLIALFPHSQTVMFATVVVLLLRLILNTLDGMLANEYAMQSNLGIVLNELGDVITDIALYWPFALIQPQYAAWLSLVVILAIVTEMAGIIALKMNVLRRYDGPMDKADRVLAFATIALLMGLGVKPGPWLLIIWLILSVLLVMTIINRIRKTLAAAT